MAQKINPLSYIVLTNAIHHQINWHFKKFPMHEEFANTNLKAAYHFHFILGLLNSIASQPQKDRTKIFYQCAHNNLRMFVVRGGEVSNLEHFFRGLFITTENIHLYDGPGAMMVQNEDSSYLLSFTSNKEGITRQ
uniref:Uncharacterized protein n=1 Tax=Romanomermis culicivorax TaxID=13658 RepID=A0A915KAU5_ROMCU